MRAGGARNELLARAIGPELSFAVNGEPVVALSDAVLREGAVGVFAGGDANEVLLERLVVQTPG